MTTAIDVRVTLKGGLFSKGIPPVVERALKEEALAKVRERINRPYRGKRLGRARNIVTPTEQELTLREDSTLIPPRTKGTSWQRKNVAIVKSMAPRVMKKAAQRIAEEMGGA